VRLGPATAAAVIDRVVLNRRDPDTIIAVEAAGTDAPRPAGGLLGRSRQLQQCAALAAGADSRLRAVVVAGPPGIGKSALVNTFVAGLDETWATLRSYCDPRHRTTPLTPFRRLFPALFAGDVEPGVHRLAAEVGQRTAGRRPVLVIEDVHDADPSTLEALDELPDLVPAGLVVMTSRSTDPLEVGGDVVPNIILGPLDRKPARALARAGAGSRPLPSVTLNEIVARSGGVPLHLLALADAVSAGLTPGDHQAASVPDSLYDSLMVRLDRIGPARSLFGRCAVLGERFSRQEVTMVSDDVPGEIDEALAALVDAGVLVAEDGHYRSAHALLTQAAYESLLNADRVALHARIADALPTAVPSVDPERLAYHLEGCGRTFDSAVAWRRASSRANRGARFPEALHHARRAVALFDEIGPAGLRDGGENRARALSNLALSLGAVEHGSAELSGVIDEARRSGASDRNPLLFGLSDISNRQALGDFRSALDASRRLLDDLFSTGDNDAIARARHYLGATLVWRGELAEGATELQLAAAHMQRNSGNAALARSMVPVWTLLALTAAMSDRFDDGDRAFDRARVAMPPADTLYQCMFGAMVAVVDQLAGRTAKVRDELEPIWTLAAEAGSDFWVTWTQVLLGWGVAEVDPPSGLGMMAEAIDASATRQILPYAQQLLGSRLCEHGHIAEGLTRLTSGVALAIETGEELWMPALQLDRARWLSVEGDSAAAAEAHADAVARATAMGANLMLRRARMAAPSNAVSPAAKTARSEERR
jgi:hypothetical protein